MNRMLQIVCLLLFLQAGQAIEPAANKYYIQLIWGTNREKPAELKFKLVGPKLRKQLSRVFQWKTYWEVNRQEVQVGRGKTARVHLSKQCDVEIQYVSATMRETRIYGQGNLVNRTREKIDCQNMAIHGGTNEVGGSWFVVVRRDKPIE